MKNNLQVFAVFLALTAIAWRPAFAQEAALPDYEVVDPEKERIEREKIINSPGEGDFRFIPKGPATTTTPAPKDSAAAAKTVVVQPSARTKQEQPVRQPEKPLIPKEDDSILSFNFLYYIIQKYKMQDIID